MGQSEKRVYTKDGKDTNGQFQASSISIAPSHFYGGLPQSKATAINPEVDTHEAVAGKSRAEVWSSPAMPGKSTWEGWAEIENDPVIFNILLQEWGVKGVKVNEVVPLDALYDSPSSSVYGLVFLSRWKGRRDRESEVEIPKDLWFANQISTYSCATVAILNIISNAQAIDLGPELSEFVLATRDMSSKDKGLKLDSYDHVRKVHNSFATLIDMKAVDRQLAQDIKDEEAKERARERESRPPQNKKQKRLHNRKNGPCNSTPPSRRSLSPIPNIDGSSDDFSEAGYHFTAYLPSHSQLWRMDGLRRKPESLGPISSEASWLDVAVAELATEWQSAAENNLEFSLLSLVEGDVGDENVEKGERLREDWGPALAEVVKLAAQNGQG